MYHNTKAQFTPIATKMPAWSVVPVSHLSCKGSTALPIAVREMMVGRIKGKGIAVRKFLVLGGHGPFVSIPDEIVDVLVKVIDLV